MGFRLYIWPRYILECDGRKISLTPLQGCILSRLAFSPSATNDDLTDSLYGHRADGGAMDPDNIIKVTIHRLRKKLSGTSLEIVKPCWGSYRLMENLGNVMDRIADEVLDD